VTSLLRAEGLSAGYAGAVALVDVGLHVDTGEMVALLGANGAGKTTTLLALAGVVRPTGGEVTILGQTGRRSTIKLARSGVALVPEQRSTFRGLTIKENLQLGRGSVDMAIGLFPELEKRLKTKAGLVSGGEQQMLALARILAGRPKLILADELSLGLAPLVVRRLFAALRQAADGGAGVLLVEQHPRVALQWTDRAYVLRRGSVALAGDSQELLKRESDVAALYL